MIISTLKKIRTINDVILMQMTTVRLRTFFRISLGDSFGENHLPKPTYAFTAKENKVNKVVLLNETKLKNQINRQNEGTQIDI